jgi:hypothetical protein
VAAPATDSRLSVMTPRIRRARDLRKLCIA